MQIGNLVGSCLLLVSGVWAEVIRPQQAAAAVGRTITLEFEVQEVGQSGQNTVPQYLELYSSARWDDPGCVFIRVPKEIIEYAGGLGMTDMRNVFKGRTVQAKGTPGLLPFSNKADERVVCLTLKDVKDLKISPPQLIVKEIEGFTVRVNRQQTLICTREVRDVEAAVREQLQGVVAMVNPKQLAALRKIPITIQRGANRSSAAYDWRTETESIVRTTAWQGVMIDNWYEFMRTIKEEQPLVLLHEMAHAYHHQVLGPENKDVRYAYQNAMQNGLYKKVARLNARPQEAYATTNEREYFCEITEAWFGANDFYPFNHDELIKHDPVGAKLMQDVWGQPRAFAKPSSTAAAERK